MGTSLNHRNLPPTAWGFTGYEGTPDGGRSAVKRILLAVSNAQSSSNAVALVAAMAHAQSSEVFVIHVSERLFMGRCYWDLESPEDALELVKDIRADLGRLGVSAEVCTDTSLSILTSRRIVDAAAGLNAELIVIGRPHGKSILAAAVRGSVAHELLHRSSIPVLVVA